MDRLILEQTFGRNIPIHRMSKPSRFDALDRVHIKDYKYSYLIKLKINTLQGAVAGIRRRGLSDGLTLTRWRNAIFRVAGATN